MCDSLLCFIFIKLGRIHFLSCSTNCLKSGFAFCVFLFYFIIIMWNPLIQISNCPEKGKSLRTCGKKKIVGFWVGPLNFVLFKRDEMRYDN